MPGPSDSAHAPVLVTGAGGFIGGHLVAALLARGRVVRAVDLGPTEHWQQCFDAAQNMRLDLSRAETA